MTDRKKKASGQALWQQVKGGVDPEELTLGPYFSHQVRHSPRHILFTYARYKFAARMLPQDRPVSVLDIGCNEGVGTLMLAEGGHDVVGIDFDEAAIAHAQETLQRDGLNFRLADATLNSTGIFDAVVCMDVIEHVYPNDQAAFMEKTLSNIKDDGMMVIGTPNDTASQYASPASQLGHVNLFTADRLQSLLHKHFQHVFMFGMNDEVLHTGFHPMCHYLLALACAKRISSE